MKPDHSSGADQTRFVRCVYFFDGFVQALAVATLLSEDAGAKPPVSVCFPSDVTMAQRIALFDKWASENPAEHDRGAGAGVVVSLHRAFPCK